MVIGGAEDKVRERVILTRFVALAGGPDARIAVISSASSLGPLAGEMYRKVFTELGAAEVTPDPRHDPGAGERRSRRTHRA